MKNLLLIRELLGDKISAVVYLSHQPVLVLRDAKDLEAVLRLLRDSSSFSYSQLLDILCVDYYGREERFEVTYCLLNPKTASRIYVRVKTSSYLKSVTNLYSSANWLEREVYDMFGVYFVEHPDLRRILTDYGFAGYPLRKDFPLSGYFEKRYDDTEKRIVQEPLELTQSYRDYTINKVWDRKK